MFIDFSLDDKEALHITEKSLILQQIDLLFDTKQGDVFGDRSFGTNYDSYLYKLGLNAESIKYQVQSDLQLLELFSYVPQVQVYLLQGTEKDICLINIQLISDTDKIEKTYKIQ